MRASNTVKYVNKTCFSSKIIRKSCPYIRKNSIRVTEPDYNIRRDIVRTVVLINGLVALFVNEFGSIVRYLSDLNVDVNCFIHFVGLDPTRTNCTYDFTLMRFQWSYCWDSLSVHHRHLRQLVVIISR